MKQMKLLSTVIAVGILAMTMAETSLAQAVKQRTGKVARMKGSARYSLDGGKTWAGNVQVGQEFKSGMTVQTAKQAWVDFAIADAAAPPPKAAPPGTLQNASSATQRDVVRILEDTVLSFDKLTMREAGSDTITETQVNLRSGKVFFTVKKMSAGSNFEIVIPNGVAGIRGTVGLVTAEGTLAILHGSGVLAYSKPDGSLVTQVVPSGYIFDAPANALARMMKNMEGSLGRLSQECFYPGGPPPHPPRPIHHYSPHKPKGPPPGLPPGPPSNPPPT